MRFHKMSWTCAAIALLTVNFSFHAGDKQTKKVEAVVVINIEGKGENAKYIKEGDKKQQPVVVIVGQTVRWQNKSNVTHTATEGIPDKGKPVFDTGNIKKGKNADILFDQKLFEQLGGKAGGEIKVNYYCIPHSESMKSSLLLRSAAKTDK